MQDGRSSDADGGGKAPRGCRDAPLIPCADSWSAGICFPPRGRRDGRPMPPRSGRLPTDSLRVLRDASRSLASPSCGKHNQGTSWRQREGLSCKACSRAPPRSVENLCITGPNLGGNLGTGGGGAGGFRIRSVALVLAAS